MSGLTHDIVAKSCPWRVMARDKWMCKPLIGQPNGALCNTDSNCACLYITELIVNEMMARVVKMLDDRKEMNEGA
jgi:hypothetical protein